MDTIKKIIIADDHPIFRMGLAAIIKSLSNYELVAEASNGQEAINLLEKHKPHFIILDIDMPIVTGVGVANYIIENHLITQIIFMTAHTDPLTFQGATEFNNASFIFKESAVKELSKCFEEMEAGRTFVSPICKKFIENASKEAKKIKQIKSNLNLLTPSELAILKLIANHKTTQQIADELHNSYKTIENHRTNICQKIGISGSNNLLLFAIENRDIIDSY